VSDFSPHDWRWSLIMADRAMAAKFGLPISALTSVQRLIGMVLAQHQPNAFPDYDLIAAEAGLGRSTAIQAVGELAELAYMEIERGGGRGKSNRYRMLLPKGSTPRTVSGERVQLTEQKQSRTWTRRSNGSEQLSVDDVGPRAVVDRPRFELLTSRLGRFTAAQEREALAAFEEAPDGFTACCEMARSGRQPPALLLHLIRSGEHHRQRPTQARPPADQRASGRCIECGVTVHNGLYFGGQVYCAEHEERAA